MTAEYVAVIFLEPRFNWDVVKVTRASNRGKKSYGEQGNREAGVFGWEDTTLESTLTGLHTLKRPSCKKTTCLLLPQDSGFRTRLAVTRGKNARKCTYITETSIPENIVILNDV